ncbi:MAG: hypothetical protein ABI679_13090 [Gemmatimonadota bacterium]
MADGLPARIDRATLERIIQRATELQTGSHDIGENLTSEEVLKLGKDVGIDEGYLQQALLEETTKAHLEEDGGFWNRLVGPGIVSAQRVIMGDVESIEQQLIRWIDENELFAIQRQQPGRISWEPVGGFQAAIRRSTSMLGGGKRPFMLARANGVTATILPLEAGYCNVVLTASLGKERASYVGGAAAMASVAAVGAAALAVMSPFILVALIPLPFGAGLSWVIGRRYRPIAERTQLGLERMLDQIERGAVKPSHQLPGKNPGLIGIIADEVKKALKP